MLFCTRKIFTQIQQRIFLTFLRKWYSLPCVRRPKQSISVLFTGSVISDLRRILVYHTRKPTTILSTIMRSIRRSGHIWIHLKIWVTIRDMLRLCLEEEEWLKNSLPPTGTSEISGNALL